MAMDPRWTQVDDFIADALFAPDAALDAALKDSSSAGLPAINVTAPQGRLLQILAQSVGAKAILEIGTLGGYSTIWLGRALPPDGRLITLELDPRAADVARINVARAGLQSVVEVRLGRALESLDRLIVESRGSRPFDLVFIDADKTSNADYFQRSLALTHVGSLIIIDNTVRGGAIVDLDSIDPSVVGTRRAFQAMTAEPGVNATVIQTVGSKGYDGFALARVLRL